MRCTSKWPIEESGERIVDEHQVSAEGQVAIISSRVAEQSTLGGSSSTWESSSLLGEQSQQEFPEQVSEENRSSKTGAIALAKPGANGMEVASTVPRNSPRSNANSNCHLGEQLLVLSIAVANLGAHCRQVASAAPQSKSSGNSISKCIGQCLERGLTFALLAH